MKKISLCHKFSVKTFSFFLILFLGLIFSPKNYANGGIGNIGVFIQKGTTTTLYKVYDAGWGDGNGITCSGYDIEASAGFSGLDLGVINDGGSLTLKGIGVAGWTDNSDWIAGRIEYKIWKQGDTEPTSTSTFDVGGYGSACSSSDIVCSSSNNRMVGINNQSVNLINGLSPGVYNFKITPKGQLRYNCGAWGDTTPPSVTATFTINPVVTFNNNGGSGTMSNQSVTYNTSTALNSNSFTRSGYSFNGWNTASDGSSTNYADQANVTLTSNLTLYAKWTSSNTSPTVTTASISNITSSTASSGGTVTSDGGASVTAEGVCWSTSSNPTTSDSKTSDGTSTPFTSSITSLSAQTQYHVRAYATNSVGTGYGSDVSFYTLSSAPTTGSFAWGTNTGCGSAVLNWTGATFPSSGATNKGYILLRALTGITPSLSNANGAIPTAGSGTTIVANYNSSISSSATTYTDNSIYDGKTYNYVLVPFTWDGTNTATLNYLTGLASTSVTVNPPVNWANLETGTATVCAGNNATVYGELYAVDQSGNKLTTSTSNASMFIVQYAVNSGNSDPSGWITPDKIVWTTISSPTTANNNLVYSASFGSSLTAGTYYYSFRYSPAGCTNWFYGAAKSTSPGQGQGGAWNGTTNINGVLTINGTTTITLTSTTGTDNQTVCQSSSITNITYNIANATGANVTGLPAGVTGSYSGGVLTISGTPSVSGTFNYTVTPSGGCGSTTATGTITVNAIPSITTQPSTTAQNYCLNSTATALSITASNVTGYQWYSNTANSNSGGTLISGATSSSYTPSTANEVTLYYYCVLSNANCTLTSNVSGAITVSAGSSPTGWWTTILTGSEGKPKVTYYLGDKLSDVFYFEGNNNVYTAVGNSCFYGIGQATNGSNWTWRAGTYVGADGSNYKYQSKANEHQFTATGNWYYAGKFQKTSDCSYAYADTVLWTESDAMLNGRYYYQVNPLDNPTSQVAYANTTNALVDSIKWNKDNAGHDVLIVRYPTGSSPTAPVNGTAYTSGVSIGSGTVLYKGAGTSTTYTKSSSTFYDYYFYSENFGYYSTGVMTTSFSYDPSDKKYYKSIGGDWSNTNSWKYDTNLNGTYNNNPPTIPNAASDTIIVATGTTVNLNTSASIMPGKLYVQTGGTLNLLSGGSINTPPIYASGSTLLFSTATTFPTNLWSKGSSSGAGYPSSVKMSANVTVSLAGADSLFMGGDLTVDAGKTFSLTMPAVNSGDYGKTALKIRGNIINNGTITESTQTHRAISCVNFTNTGTVVLASDGMGADLILTGNFTNNASAGTSVNINGRALILRGSTDQSIGGTATGPYYFDYFMINKTGGKVILGQDITCDGTGTDHGVTTPGMGITISSATTLDLNGKTITAGASSSDVNGGGFSSVNSSSLIAGNGGSIILKGTKNTVSAGTVYVDQTTDGATNKFSKIIMNRGGSDTFTVNGNVVIKDTVSVVNSTLVCNNNVTLDSTAVGTLSKTNPTAVLTVNNLVFTRSLSNAAEFYKNSKTLTINGTATTKVNFARLGKWHFISFPYAVNIKKSDNTTGATIGSSASDGDLGVYWYDPALRAQNKSGWTQLKGGSLSAGVGYIIAKRNTDESLYFEPAAALKGDNAIFNNTASVNVSYTTATLDCNAGWNFLSHPLAASAIPSLSQGQFAYNFVYDADYYKLYYYQDNPHYTYSTGLIKPFSAFFVKVPSGASAVSYDITSTALGVKRKNAAESTQEIIPIYLNANNYEYETLVRVMPEATLGQDELYDAPYNTPMSSSTPRLYTLIDNYMYALNSLPEGNAVPMGIRVPAAATYRLTWTPPANGLQATLTDNQTSTVTDMTSATSYEFSVSAADAAKDITNRFVINIPQKTPTGLNMTKGDFPYKISVRNKVITLDGLMRPAKAALYDTTGKLIEIQETNTFQTRFKAITEGVYVLQVSDKNGSYQTKIVSH